MKRCLLALLTCAYLPVLHAQDSFSSVEEQMTSKEFQAAGLHKLTAEELAALNDWLRDHSVATLDSPARPAAAAGAAARPAAPASGDAETDRRGMPRERDTLSDEEKVIVSRYLGTFTGWDGNTVFRLENGMVWARRQSAERCRSRRTTRVRRFRRRHCSRRT